MRGLRSEVGTLSGKLQGTVTFSSNLPFAAQVVGIISGFLLIVHRDNTYHLPKKPKLSDLERLPFVSFLSERMDDSGEPYFENMDATLFVKNPVLSVNNYHLMLRYVLHGVGAAIMDEMCLKASSYGTDWRPLVSYPLDEFLPTVRYGILVRKRKHLSPQAKGLIENIREELAKTNLPA